MTESMNFLNAIMDGNEESMHYATYLYEQAERYRWHDLRKDPDDVPMHDGLYAVAIDYDGMEVGLGQWETVYGYGSGWTALMPQVQAVVAWKEIEPFEVDEVSE